MKKNSSRALLAHWAYWPAPAWAILFCALAASAAAQSIPCPAPPPPPSEAVTLSQGKPFHKVSGMVSDMDFKPLTNATVQLHGWDGRPLHYGTETKQSRFSLSFPADEEDGYLVFAHLGYETRWVPLSQVDGAFFLQLAFTPYELPEVAVKSYRVNYIREILCGGCGRLPKEEKQLPLTPADPIEGIYPNPWVSDLNLVLHPPHPMRLSIQMHDAAGRLLHSEVRDLPEGPQVLPLSMGAQQWPAGTYVLSVLSAGEAVLGTRVVVKGSASGVR